MPLLPESSCWPRISSYAPGCWIPPIFSEPCSRVPTGPRLPCLQPRLLILLAPVSAPASSQHRVPPHYVFLAIHCASYMPLCAMCAWAPRNRRRRRRRGGHNRSWGTVGALSSSLRKQFCGVLYMALQCAQARTTLPSAVISLITHIACTLSCLITPSYCLW